MSLPGFRTIGHHESIQSGKREIETNCRETRYNYLSNGPLLLYNNANEIESNVLVKFRYQFCWIL